MMHTLKLPPINLNQTIQNDSTANLLVEGIPSIVYVSPDEIDSNLVQDYRRNKKSLFKGKIYLMDGITNNLNTAQNSSQKSKRDNSSNYFTSHRRNQSIGVIEYSSIDQRKPDDKKSEMGKQNSKNTHSRNLSGFSSQSKLLNTQHINTYQSSYGSESSYQKVTNSNIGMQNSYLSYRTLNQTRNYDKQLEQRENLTLRHDVSVPSQLSSLNSNSQQLNLKIQQSDNQQSNHKHHELIKWNSFIKKETDFEKNQEFLRKQNQFLKQEMEFKTSMKLPIQDSLKRCNTLSNSDLEESQKAILNLNNASLTSALLMESIVCKSEPCGKIQNSASSLHKESSLKNVFGKIHKNSSTRYQQSQLLEDMEEDLSDKQEFVTLLNSGEGQSLNKFILNKHNQQNLKAANQQILNQPQITMKQVINQEHKTQSQNQQINEYVGTNQKISNSKNQPKIDSTNIYSNDFLSQLNINSGVEIKRNMSQSRISQRTFTNKQTNNQDYSIKLFEKLSKLPSMNIIIKDDHSTQSNKRVSSIRSVADRNTY
eukprot:403360813